MSRQVCSRRFLRLRGFFASSSTTAFLARKAFEAVAGKTVERRLELLTRAMSADGGVTSTLSRHLCLDVLAPPRRGKRWVR